MIRAASNETPHQTAFTNGRFSSVADVPQEKGGNGAGFGPHELLEAALATCMVMTVELAAAKLGVPLQRAHCEVNIDRSIPGSVTLHYVLHFDGALSDAHSQQLRDAAEKCPVARTLSGGIAFSSTPYARAG
jgi:putative redox protein